MHPVLLVRYGEITSNTQIIHHVFGNMKHKLVCLIMLILQLHCVN